MQHFLIGAAFGFFRLIAPSRAHHQFSIQELEAAAKRYRRLKILSLILFLLVFWPTASLAWGLAFTEIAYLRIAQMPAHLLLVRLQPEWLIWGVPTLFMGIISGGLLLMMVLRLFFNAELWRLMIAAGNHRVGYDSWRVLRWLAVGFVLLATAWVFLELDCYTRFEADRMAINPLIGLGEKVYRYDQIAKLVEATHLVAPNGKLVERTRQFVVFDDGEQWCHDGELPDPTPLIELLKSKTGRSFERVRFIEESAK